MRDLTIGEANKIARGMAQLSRARNYIMMAAKYYFPAKCEGFTVFEHFTKAWPLLTGVSVQNAGLFTNSKQKAKITQQPSVNKQVKWAIEVGEEEKTGVKAKGVDAAERFHSTIFLHKISSIKFFTDFFGLLRLKSCFLIFYLNISA
jgi:hypothetical protein